MDLANNPLISSIAALVTLADDLHASGAVRTEQGEKFGILRTGLQQLAALIDDCAKLAIAPAGPDAAAFEALGEKVQALATHLETVAMTVDHAADQVAALVEKAAA